MSSVDRGSLCSLDRFPQGFLVLDKPAGITSFDAVACIRRALNIKRVGHLGTLDPLATGVLVLALGEATKLVPHFNRLDKVYFARFELGKISTTFDLDGILETVDPHPQISKERLQEIVESYRGVTEQVPPSFSAIKLSGKRAYAMARAGKSFQLQSRRVTCYSIDLLRYENPFAEIRLHCAAGFYVRSLVYDIGQILSCGAVLVALRRLSVGPFTLDQATNSDYSEHVIPLEKLVEHWDGIALTHVKFHKIRSGQTIVVPQGFCRKTPDHPIAGFYQNRLISLLELEGGHLKVLKNFAFDLNPSDL